MTAPALARLTSAGVVAVGALVLGHVLNPFAGGRAHAGALAAFAAAVGALGAWRGWREAVVRAEWEGRRPGPGAGRRAAALGAALALGAAGAGHVAVHGAPAGWAAGW